MKFCPNCGSKLNPQNRFCTECGSRIDQVDSSSFRNNGSSDEGAYESAPSCPYCGAPLNSFSGICTGCGREIYRKSYATACQKLCEKLEQIESGRPKETVLSFIAGYIDKATDNVRLKPTDQKKIEAINGFVVPNSKADILEFLMLAESRIEALSHRCDDEYLALASEYMKQAWQSKHDQVLDKAELLLSADPDFIKIRNAYQSKRASRFRQAGLCQHCGGRFKGAINKVCRKCGKPKDY